MIPLYLLSLTVGMKIPLLDRVSNGIQQEQKKVKAALRLPKKDFTEEELLATNMEALITNLKRNAPILWRLIKEAAWSRKQERKARHKTPDRVSCLLDIPPKAI